jgi:hypothetical protein
MAIGAGRTRLFVRFACIYSRCNGAAQMTISTDDQELLDQTHADILHLEEAFDPATSDDQLRRVSPVLRNLLVHGHYRTSWRLLCMQPKSPTIIAPRLKTDGVPEGSFAMAGGGQTGPGRQISNFMLSPGIQNVAGVVTDEQDYQFPLSEYMASCSIFAENRKISRHQIVLYVANKRGGAHLDRKRKDDDASYKALDTLSFIGIGGSRDDEVITEKPKHPAFFELLSIGQQVFNSPDTKRLIARYEELFS